MTCRECKHCRKIVVPVLPCFDHARTVRNRYVCSVNEGEVTYLGDDEGKCDLFEPKEAEE